jgi:hypothetical protein
MVRSIIIISIFLCTVLSVQAETVSLSGTVKKTGGTTGIAGVKVSLAKVKNLSGTSDANGAFAISGSTATIASAGREASSPRFLLKGNSIVFSSAFPNLTGTVDIFSSDGKRKTSIQFNDLPAGKQSATLPQLYPGINIVRITINNESFTRTIICLGNDLFLKNELLPTKNQANFSLAKQTTAPIADTIVAEKTGYITKKVTIDSYNKQNIPISLDSIEGNPGACTREALQAAVDKYIEAQKAGDPTKMPLASNVKYIQNMKDITADKSIVKTALPTIASQINIFDVDSCRSFTELIITAGSHPYVIGTRLTLHEGKIFEINTIVTDQDDWNFSASSYLNLSKNEKWDTLPTAQRSDRQTLINACNAYFDKIFDWTKDTIPWHSDCYRIEGGKEPVAKPCSQGTEGNSVNTTCRTYVTDLAKGAINIYCYFGFGPDSHLFRLVDKKVLYIHTMTACGDTVGAKKDCWGTAAKGKGKAYCDWYSH